MNNKQNQLSIIQKIAIALAELNEKVVYVGGSVVGLYVNDPAAEDVRPTKDIDISLQILTISDLESLRESLQIKGFVQNAEDNVICRFRYDGILVDVMSTKEVGWAPANPWFGPGFQYLEEVVIGHQKIQILSLPYFVASKFVAFENRGSKDPRFSHDLEDITYILDNRTDLVAQLKNSPEDVFPYLKKKFSEMLENKSIQEAMLGNLFYETAAQRLKVIIEKLKCIVNEI